MSEPYGYVIAKQDLDMYVWDGSMAKVRIKQGDKLDITYIEQDDSLGLTFNGIEVCCSLSERTFFEEYWNEEAINSVYEVY